MRLRVADLESGTTLVPLARRLPALMKVMKAFPKLRAASPHHGLQCLGSLLMAKETMSLMDSFEGHGMGSSSLRRGLVEIGDSEIRDGWCGSTLNLDGGASLQLGARSLAQMISWGMRG